MQAAERSHLVEASTAGRTEGQVWPHFNGPVRRLGPLPPDCMLLGPFAFNQARLETLAREVTPGRKPVKFRRRETQFPPNPFELRANAAELIAGCEPGDDRPKPAGQRAGPDRFSL